MFVPFTTQGLKLADAANLAVRLTDTSAARSFKITKVGSDEPVVGNTKAQLSRLLPFGQYRPSKRDADVFVERSRFAINTPGEKFEIRPKNIMGGMRPIRL